jgi:hypothetical protein
MSQLPRLGWSYHGIKGSNNARVVTCKVLGQQSDSTCQGSKRGASASFAEGNTALGLIRLDLGADEENDVPRGVPTETITSDYPVNSGSDHHDLPGI